jgi:hypothetical protein
MGLPCYEGQRLSLRYPRDGTGGMEFAPLTLPFRIPDGGTIVYQDEGEDPGQRASPLGPSPARVPGIR